MEIHQAKQKLDSLIKKSRVHLYKPIQIAEILNKSRLEPNILNITDVSTYRNASKKWRDGICDRFIGRSSRSSQKYQDDLFNENAIPPKVLMSLDAENKSKNGVVEKYIYMHLQKRLFQIEHALDYCTHSSKSDFNLNVFIQSFYAEAGLKRSIDKIFEIIVYALFDAYFNRVGITNAADRGLDMYANFGSVVQVKHLSLGEKLAHDIVGTVSSNRIIIVCKKAEEKVITSLLNQIGWKDRIQSIVTLEELVIWYERALRGTHSDILGDYVLSLLSNEIKNEFPMLGKAKEFDKFKKQRGYNTLNEDASWRDDG